MTEDEERIVMAMREELGPRVMLYVQFRPRDMLWWRGLWT